MEHQTSCVAGGYLVSSRSLQHRIRIHMFRSDFAAYCIYRLLVPRNGLRGNPKFEHGFQVSIDCCIPVSTFHKVIGHHVLQTLLSKGMIAGFEF